MAGGKGGEGIGSAVVVFRTIRMTAMIPANAAQTDIRRRSMILGQVAGWAAAMAEGVSSTRWIRPSSISAMESACR